jgi:hypothetical protein
MDASLLRRERGPRLALIPARERLTGTGWLPGNPSSLPSAGASAGAKRRNRLEAPFRAALFLSVGSDTRAVKIRSQAVRIRSHP